MFINPGMIGCSVIGHEVQHQPKSAIPQSFPDPSQRRIASEMWMHGVAGNRES
jgi:hypothetical protein